MMRIHGNNPQLIYKAIVSNRQGSLRFTPSSDIFRFSALSRGLAGKLTVRCNAVATSSLDSVKSLSDPNMRRMGQSIIEVKEILFNMKSLAEGALDENLSCDERISLQIEMAKIQLTMYEKTYGMSYGTARPDYPHPFANPDVLNQYHHIINGLKNYGSDGKSTGRTILDLYSSDGRKIGDMICFYESDFILDKNGMIKMRNDVFNSLPDKFKINIDDMLESALRSSFGGFATETESAREMLSAMNISLLDSMSAADTLSKIDEQIEALGEIEAEFNSLATLDPTVSRTTRAAHNLPKGFFSTALGMMRYAPSGRDETKNRSDIRLTKADDPIGRLFKKLDEVFKDQIYGALGFGELYKSNKIAKGISPEQLTLIQEAKERLSKEHAKVDLSNKYEIFFTNELMMVNDTVPLLTMVVQQDGIADFIK